MASTRTVTTCSDCMADVAVDVDALTVTVKVPSNGLRGSKHVPAHTLTAEAAEEGSGLIVWECPACGHADSLDVDA